MASAAAANQAPSVQEYSIRVPKNTKKTYKVMRFNSSVNVDFTKWGQVKMERENNMKEFKGTEEEMPKFGAGSEFGREAREEARRKKFGIVSKKYRPEDQPWLLKVGGKTGKKFKGTREGGVAENAAYYVFTHAPDGAIEAFPLQEWYNFQPTQRYKALSAEEAEQEFGRRNKQVNYFSLMMRKRLRGENEEDPEEGDENKTKSKKGKGKKGELKISEMDDWVESSDTSDSEEETKEQEEEKKDAKKKKNVANAKKKKKKDPDDEAFEESDDGDEEGREVDYISDSSESASDHETKANKELKGVEEEDGLRKLLSSGEEDEEEEEKQEGEKEEEPDDKQKEAAGESKSEKEKKSKKKSQKKKKRKDDDTNGLSQISKDSSSDLSSDSSDSEGEAKKKPGKPSKEPNSGASSRSATPTKEPGTGDESRKRKADPGGELSMSKKSRLDNFASATLSPVGSLNTGESGITEDAVRRYLMRKPMTTTELLQKFKSKKTGLTSEQLVHIMTQILKRINPVKQTIKGKMYLSIKG